MLGWNWPIDSEGEDFKISSLLFHTYLPLEKGVVLFSYKLKFPSHKDVYKMGSVVLEYILKLFCNYLSLERRVTLHLNKLESQSLKDALW